MALDLDAFAVLRAIADHPDLFAEVHPDLNKAARACITKRLKSKTTDVAALRAVCQALGQRSFGLIVDGLKDAEVKALVGRLDKHHSGLKAADPLRRRRHLRALADNAIEPVAKPAPVRKAPADRKKRDADPAVLSSKAMAAVRKRARN